jgi:UDP-N-acetylmuramoylalanine--D-glutamate ligase
MGVSGLAVAEAALARGDRVTVFDERPNDSAASLSATDRLAAAGAEAVTGWHGQIDAADFDVLVLSPGFPERHPAVLAMAAAGKEVWGEIEFAYRIAQAPIIAVTGTNGKSTTTVLAWQLAQAAGLKARLCGNIAGSGYEEAALSEAARFAGPDEWLVAEVSSFQLLLTPTFRARAAAITNVTPDHFDRHAGFDDYYAAKLRLFANTRPEDTAVVNTDEPFPSAEDVRRVHRGRIQEVSPAKGWREDGSATLGGHVLEPGRGVLRNRHDFANASVAWSLVAQAADPGQAGALRLAEFRGLAHRMELVAERGGVAFVNNSMCTNPAAFVSSSRGLPGRQLILLGGVTKGLDFAPVGAYLRPSPHSVYLFGPEPERWRAVLGVDAPWFASLEDATAAAASDARPGESVLLCPGGASAEPYANFRERGEAFRAAVQTLVGQ